MYELVELNKRFFHKIQEKDTETWEKNKSKKQTKKQKINYLS